LQDEAKRRILDVNRDLKHGQVASMLCRWFVEAEGADKGYLWEDNKGVVKWLEEQLKDGSMVNENIKCLQRDTVINKIRSLIKENPEVSMDSVIHITQLMPQNQRNEAVKILTSMEPKNKTS